MTNLNTGEEITWCPGCQNFLIKKALEDALKDLMKEGMKKEDIVLVTDIGCASKIYDYMNLSGFNTLHGRVLPTAFGVKIGNPNLKVLGFAGDGGTYNEGIEHLIHVSRYNSNFAMFVHNNQIFALTVGQATATTEQGFVEKTHPFGVKEKTLNPLVLALEAGATFVARAGATDIEKTKEIIQQAIKHKGFAFVEFIQPCIALHNTIEELKNSYYVKTAETREEAIKEAKKWNYTHHEEYLKEQTGKVPLGIFFKEETPCFEDNYPVLKKLKDMKKGFVNEKKERRVEI